MDPSQKSPRLAGTGGGAAKRLKEVCFIFAAFASAIWLSYAAGVALTSILLGVL
jgi:hypothetical protein